MDSSPDKTRDILQQNFLFLMEHMDFTILMLCFLYAHEDSIIDKLFMEDYMHTTPSKRKFDLLMHLSKMGQKGMKALVQGLVYTGQKHLADVLDREISTEFYVNRSNYHPSF